MNHHTPQNCGQNIHHIISKKKKIMGQKFIWDIELLQRDLHPKANKSREPDSRAQISYRIRFANKQGIRVANQTQQSGRTLFFRKQGRKKYFVAHNKW